MSGHEKQTSQTTATKIMTHMLAAVPAAIMAEFVAYPFWTIETIQRIKRISFLRAFHEIYHGKGFYAGFSVSLYAAVPAALLYLLGSRIPPWLFNDPQVNNHHVALLQGPCAQTLCMLVYGPAMQIIMQRQSDNIANKFNWGASKVLSLYRKTFWLLLSTTVTLELIAFWSLAQFNKNYSAEEHARLNTQIFATASAFTFATVLTMPFDTLATHLSGNKKYSDQEKLFSAMKKLHGEVGMRGLYKGFFPSIAYHSIWATTFFVTQRALSDKIENLKFSPH
ncbi:MAG TPA: MC/SLC25 family protein [Coxiellaceae bacterium]|nr:MAG: hypothetical protein A3E81_04595 [Gammaproteobacteria bacterium RIFCSPHIGHO2_12_FULL_36_30]HLB55966.1 MC/SLC25 family protein [Coxiellaceae bacterium]